jgi:hypothetical protein
MELKHHPKTNFPSVFAQLIKTYENIAPLSNTRRKKNIVGHKTEIVIVYKIQCLFVNE